ncbi:response regulator [Pseudonocardia acidicola]|uniref:Response regulator transcription factor n=1 Tax=Pseudonocardia acidicola TaxID=2724939 RepID=A0ABX1SHE7_9PSEU|nr:response regulator transcription factor [Pseudonocardia acidicola]
MTVVVADDHPVYRDGLANAIDAAGDLKVVGQAGDGKETLTAIRTLAPDVAVVDLQLPDMDGLEVLLLAEKEGLRSQFVIVSAFDDSVTVYRAIEAGVRAYLPKVSPAAELCDAIRSVAQGHSVIPPALQTALATEIRRRQQKAEPVLTPREAEVLALTAEGLSAPEIAERLFVGVTTVKSHLQHVYVKLDVSDRAAAVARAHRLGLLT